MKTDVRKVKNVLWLFGLLLGGISAFSQSSWSVVLPHTGTFSSPRVADLNRDGVGDIILGAGKNEFQTSDTAVVALDGRTGKVLWVNSARDQMFISVGLLDINKDGVPDVIAGGRSAELMALDGTNGRDLWRFDTVFYSNAGTKRWFNFYNPQIIEDQDGDGLPDILISNGGDIKVPPYDPNRATGRLVVLSGKTGRLLGEAMMPDGKEIYMSVAALKKDEGYRIIFGTGGETIGGNLFVGTLDQVMAGDLSQAVRIATSPNKGFIAPPAWVDVTGDGEPDVVANAVDGRLLAFDGKDLSLVWVVKIPNTEAYSSLGIGQYTDDGIPDFFVSYAQGVWPNLEWTQQVMVDGQTGHILFRDSMGFYQTSTPVSVDVNNDGREEGVLSVNYQVLDDLGRKQFYNTLMVVEFKTGEVVQLIDGLPGHNISSTPWIGDLDNDGFLDIVFCHSNDPWHTYTFDGMQVNCLKTKIAITKPVKWGSYMGSSYDGIYRN